MRCSFCHVRYRIFFRNWEKIVILLLNDYDYLVAPTNKWDEIAKENDIEIVKFARSG